MLTLLATTSSRAVRCSRKPVPRTLAGLRKEGWSFEGRGILFYTDDVGLFSTTRRLSRDGDPTQPAIDSKLTNKGSDMVFEPLLTVRRSLTNGLGRLDLNVQGEGFIFTEHTEFNHGTLKLIALQDLSPQYSRASAILLRS